MFYVHAIVGRMSHSFAPDLYKHMKLDAADECAALGILLAARDADLEGHGVTANDPRRKEIQLCYSILSKPEVRKLYDDAIAAGRKITWPEVEHLANFGTWPDPVTRMNVSESRSRPTAGPGRRAVRNRGRNGSNHSSLRSRSRNNHRSSNRSKRLIRKHNSRRRALMRSRLIPTSSQIISTSR